MQIELKRTSVQVKPRASLCTATYEAVSNRGGVEPLLLQEYVHGNQEGWMILSIVIIMGIYALIIGLLIMWDKEKLK